MESPRIYTGAYKEARESFCQCHEKREQQQSAGAKMGRRTISTMAAAGTIFGNSQPGNVPARVPDNAEAHAPARHAPFFQYLKPLVK
eukprot:6591557-Pyramimonas_sp.AAC.1